MDQDLYQELERVRLNLQKLENEIKRLEALIQRNEVAMEPVLEVYKKISASSEVGGFVAKVIGGLLGALGAVASLWLIFRGGGNG